MAWVLRGSRQLLHELLDVRNTDAGNHVIAAPCAVGAVAAASDIAETGRAHQRIERRVEEGKGRRAGRCSRLVQQSTEGGPDRRAPARSADLGYVPMEDQQSSGLGIGGRAHV